MNCDKLHILNLSHPLITYHLHRCTLVLLLLSVNGTVNAVTTITAATTTSTSAGVTTGVISAVAAASAVAGRCGHGG